MTKPDTSPHRPAGERFLFAMDGKIHEVRDLLILAMSTLERNGVIDNEEVPFSAANAVLRALGDAACVVERMENEFDTEFEAMRIERGFEAKAA